MKTGQRTVEGDLKELFEHCFKEPLGGIAALSADGSNRRYFRLTGGDQTAIGAWGPDPKENAAFLGFSRHFKKIKLPVPEIYGENAERGVYIEEDLGDTTLFQFLSENRAPEGPNKPALEIYKQVIPILARFQIAGAKGLNHKLCYPRTDFDKQSMLWDMNHFKYYFLQLAGIVFHEEALEKDFQRFADFLIEAPADYFLYRDFQSRNIMIKNGEPYFIDYQGGRKGALQYDIASLLFDAKADLPFALREQLLKLYLEAVSELTTLDVKKFLKYYPGFVLIRIMQAMGAYGLRGFHERKSHFLQSIPYAIQNIEYLLRKYELPIKAPELMNVLQRLVGSTYLRQLGQAHLKLTVRIHSFSYKSGIAMDPTGHGGGYVFDCRALPNPGRDPQYAALTGQDPEVIEFLDKEPAVKEFLSNVLALVNRSVENYRGRNFTDLSVAFGCTGGQHRSVYCAEKLARHLKEKLKVSVEVSHRELANKPKKA
ncbi:MAG: phosphotransferase [Elusimicrobia bacterium]|nr:phosphotransferase [Elusimicrobiota bacterium]